MAHDLLTEIKTKMPGFSKGQKRIATYIMEHYDKAAFMTASRLGGTVGVSESTVVRFAAELGFEGYPELQAELQELIRSKLTTVQRIEVSDERIPQGDVLEKVLNSDVEKIRKTLAEISKKDFDNAVDAIAGAETVYIIGVRSSSALADFLGFYFNLILANVKLVDTSGVSEIYEQMMRIRKGDVVVGISFPRYSSRTVKAMQYACDKGATVIALTDSNMSPITRFATYTLLARSDMASFVDSLVAPLSLINALIVAVGLKRREDVYKTFAELEHVWDAYEVYEKPGENGQ